MYHSVQRYLNICVGFIPFIYLQGWIYIGFIAQNVQVIDGNYQFLLRQPGLIKLSYNKKTKKKILNKLNLKE